MSKNNKLEQEYLELAETLKVKIDMATALLSEVNGIVKSYDMGSLRYLPYISDTTAVDGFSEENLKDIDKKFYAIEKSVNQLLTQIGKAGWNTSSMSC